MTEIPEHLLKRADAALRKAAGASYVPAHLVQRSQARREALAAKAAANGATGPLGSIPPRWTREDCQRTMFNTIQSYEQARFLGGDSELLRDAIRIMRQTLIDNDFYPEDDRGEWNPPSQRWHSSVEHGVGPENGKTGWKALRRYAVIGVFGLCFAFVAIKLAFP